MTACRLLNLVMALGSATAIGSAGLTSWHSRSKLVARSSSVMMAVGHYPRMAMRGAVGTRFGFEGRAFHFGLQPQAAHHVIQNVVMQVSDPGLARQIRCRKQRQDV